MNWKLTYLGPELYYQDFVDGKVYHRGDPETVDTDTKIRLTEYTKRVIYQDLWEAEQIVESEPADDAEKSDVVEHSADEPIVTAETAEGVNYEHGTI